MARSARTKRRHHHQSERRDFRARLHRRCDLGSRQHSPQGHLRTRARVSRRPRRGRVGGIVRRSPNAPAGLQSLRSLTPSQRGDARRHRRSALRHTGRRCARLYVHLYHGLCDAKRPRFRQRVLGARPSQSDRWNDRRGTRTREGLRVVHRTLSHSRPSRHDRRRARRSLQRLLRHRREAARRTHGGLAAIDAVARDRSAVGDDVAEYPVMADDDRIPGHGADRRARHQQRQRFYQTVLSCRHLRH